MPFVSIHRWISASLFSSKGKKKNNNRKILLLDRNALKFRGKIRERFRIQKAEVGVNGNEIDAKCTVNSVMTLLPRDKFVIERQNQHTIP